MRLFSILFVFLIVALAGCNSIPARTPLADRPAGTLIPTAATTPVPPGQPTVATTPVPPGQPTAATAPVPPGQPTSIPPTPDAAPAAPVATAPPVPQPAEAWSPRIALQQITDGLDRPLHITHAGDGSGRLFVVEKVGRIRIVRDGRVLPEPFLDITDRVDRKSVV